MALSWPPKPSYEGSIPSTRANFKGLSMSRTVKKSYTGSKQFDKTCRSHGGCPHCESNRLRYKKIAKDLYNAGVVQLAET